MASREALRAGERCHALLSAIGKFVGNNNPPPWELVLKFQRAAIRVGEVRERGRRERNQGRSAPKKGR